jgi:predicted PurR-regulated permease PerM
VTTPPESRLRIEVAPRTILLVFGILGAIWVFDQLRTVVSVVVIALIMVGTFDPVVGWLETKGFRRGRALVLVFSVAALALIGVVLLMVPPLVAQLLDVVSNAPRTRERVIEALAAYDWAKPLSKTIQDLPLDDFDAKVGTWAITYSTNLLIVVGYGISTLFLAIYMLAEPARSKGLLFALVPRNHHIKLARILIELKVIVGGYMRGQLITSLSIAVFVFVLLTVLGAENALAIALFAGLTDIIPFVGGYVASTPVILAVTPQGTTTTLVVFILMFLYQEFESRILVPRVYGRVLRLPPAIVVVALLVGGTLAGILGALVALPIAAGLQMVIRELHLDLPGETAHADTVKELDEKATLVYEHLADGVPAAEASQIADNLATIVKQTEADALAEKADALAEKADAIAHEVDELAERLPDTLEPATTKLRPAS